MVLCVVCKHPTETHTGVPMGEFKYRYVCSDVCQAVALGNSGRERHYRASFVRHRSYLLGSTRTY